MWTIGRSQRVEEKKYRPIVRKLRYLPESQIYKNVLFIETNSLLIFICPNPVLVVRALGKWVSMKTVLMYRRKVHSLCLNTKIILTMPAFVDIYIFTHSWVM